MSDTDAARIGDVTAGFDAVAESVNLRLKIADADARTVNINRQTYIKATDYAPADDTEDAIAGLQAMLDDGAGREVVFNVPYGETSRHYRCLSRTSQLLFMRSGSRVIFEDGAILDYSGLPASGDNANGFFRVDSGADGTDYPTTADATAGDTSITISPANAVLLAASGAARYSMVRISSDKLWISGGNPTTCFQGEYRMISEINTTTGVISFIGALEDSYATADNTVVSLLDPITGSIDNIQIIGPGAFDNALGDIGVRLQNPFGFKMNGGRIEGCDFGAVFVVGDMYGRYSNITTLHGPNDFNQNQYHFCYVNACQGTIIEGMRQFSGKHGVVQSDTGAPRGVTRHVQIVSNDIQATWGAAIPTHLNAERISARFNKILGCGAGIEAGCRHFSTFKNEIDFTVTPGVGIAITEDPYKITLDGDVVRGGLYGVRLNSTSFPQVSGTQGPAEIVVRNIYMENLTQAGVEISYTADTNPHYNVTIEGIKTRNQNGVSVAVTGTFERVSIRNCDLQGNGGGFAAVTSSSVVDLDVTNVRYSGHNTPLLGGTRVKQVNVGAWGAIVPGTVLQGSETKDWPSIAAGATSFEDVTVTGCVLGDEPGVPYMNINTSTLDFSARIISANTVRVVVYNPTASPIDLGSGTLNVSVIKRV